jgi:hypothetical protein
MKKFTTLLAVFLVFNLGYSYNWNPLGTVQMNASKICFGITFSHYVICADDGIYLYNIMTHETEFYTYGLPVTGATYLDSERILVTMGDGSWSDGIWTFNLQTHQFEVVEWFVYPNFLYFDEFANTYWVGSDWGGLLKSQDGLNWVEDIYFTAKPCGTMTGYGQHLVVTAIANLSNVYWSDDSGETWNASENFPFISDMSFSPNGLLYGIFPDYSDSSGLWKSDDFGNSWQNVFYADNMSAVGFDCFGDPFVGWKDNLGIARYNPLAPPPGLTFLNSGLPNLCINKIQINPTMSAPAIFVCTDAGVYFSMDYMVGLEEQKQNENKEISFYPNPATSLVNIKSKNTINQISILNNLGLVVCRCDFDSRSIQINTADFEKGIYFIQVDTPSGFITEKLIIQ